MVVALERALYTAAATVTGGREGHGRAEDGGLQVDLRMPPELGGPGGGTNPEELFALGYAACYQSALALVARREKVDTSGSTVHAEVSVGPVPGGVFGLAVVLDVRVPGLEPAVTRRLAEAAHAVCPYSNAVRGTVEVELRVG